MERPPDADPVWDICSIAASLGSFAEARERARYREVRPQLSVERIARFLAEYPGFIDHWVQYSADKRTDGGWYLVEPERADGLPARGWVVGRLVDRRRADEQTFPDGATACAEFILRELDSWDTLADRPRSKRAGARDG